MPVTIKPSPKVKGKNADRSYSSEPNLLVALAYAWEQDAFGHQKKSYEQDASGKRIQSASKAHLPILHSSFGALGTCDANPIVPYRNGFVNGMIRAFQQDLHLTIRPDDVWLAILTQFSFYVNKNAEALRKHFVNHQDQIKLEVGDMSRPFALWDIAEMAQRLALLMKDHIVDPEVSEWLLPLFSTTTDNDLATNAMIMMATMKQYFTFVMRGGCGFPSVTLLGEASDWQMILDRLDKFEQYGEEPATWSKMLRPIIKRFIATFYLPDSEELKQFWMHAVHSLGQAGSGPTTPYSGWLTAFMFWDKDGKRTKGDQAEDAAGLPPMKLDGITLPFVDWQRDGVPTGVVEVPVTVQALDLGVTIDTVIVAGSMGVTVQKHKDGGHLMQPESGWWMLEKGRKPL